MREGSRILFNVHYIILPFPLNMPLRDGSEITPWQSVRGSALNALYYETHKAERQRMGRRRQSQR